MRYVVMLVIAGAALAAWLASDPMLARYRSWKRQHALEQAKTFIASHDVANTQIALDVALHAGPADPDTIRVAADMLEQVGALQAMRLRRAVVQMAPDSASDAAALVLCCLRFHDFNAAKDALHAMPPSLARQPVCLRAALAYAMATDDAPVADYILRQLRAQSPTDDALAYTHAVLRLKMPRAEDRATAAHELEALAAKNPKLRTPVERELAGAAIQNQDYADAAAHLSRVLAAPDATMADRLQQANIDLLVTHRAFGDIFASIAPAAKANEADAAAWLQWLIVQNRIEEANTWLESVPTSLRQSPTLRRIRADIAARRRDWATLEPLLRDGVWGPVPGETVRLAGAALTVDAPDHSTVRQEVWDMALGSANGILPALTTLLRLANAWGWSAEAERAEWAVARSYPDQTWAFQDLFNAYRRRKDTNGMREVLSKLRDSDTAVPRYQHDWALLTLLTEPSVQWNQPKAVLETLYRANPSDATYATGYAFALAQADRAKEAVAVLAKLSPEELGYPPRQPYLAYVYGVARMKAEMERANALANGPDFLPEEKTLFLRAREALVRVDESSSPPGAKPKPTKS